MIKFHGDFKGFGAEANFDVEATGDSENIVVAFLFGAALISLGAAVGFGMASAKHWLSKPDHK